MGKKITSRIYEKTNKIPVPDDQFVADSLDLYDYYDPEIRGMKKFHSLSLENKN